MEDNDVLTWTARQDRTIPESESLSRITRRASEELATHALRVLGHHRSTEGPNCNGS
jgi:hypothetical protein